MLYLLLTWLPSIACAVHVVRTGQQFFWLWIVLAFGPLGAAVYGVVVVLPDLTSGRTARGVSRAAAQVLDPERNYRTALRALDDTPTVGNRMRVAQAAEDLGRWQEAESQWSQCIASGWTDDSAVLMGHARTLLELGRYEEALQRLEQLKKLGREGETPQALLEFARAYEGLDRNTEADAAYRACVDRVPGLEAGGRYVAFLAKTNRKADAELGLAEIERRLMKIAPPLRPEARQWRDLAARAMGRA